MAEAHSKPVQNADKQRPHILPEGEQVTITENGTVYLTMMSLIKLL